MIQKANKVLSQPYVEALNVTVTNTSPQNIDVVNRNYLDSRLSSISVSSTQISNIGSGVQLIDNGARVIRSISSATSDIAILSSADTITLSALPIMGNNIGGGVEVFGGRYGNVLEFITLSAGDNCGVYRVGDTIVIDSVANSSLTSIGTGTDLVYNDNTIRTLSAGTGMRIISSSDNITLVNSISNENVGLGIGVFKQNVNSVSEFYSLSAGNNIDISLVDDTIVIDTTPISYNSIGNGVQLIDDNSNIIRGLSATGGVVLLSSIDTITLSGINNVDSVFGRTGEITGQLGDYSGIYEPDLGIPVDDNYILASNALGERYWVTPSILSEVHAQSAIDSESGWITDALDTKQTAGSYLSSTDTAINSDKLGNQPPSYYATSTDSVSISATNLGKVGNVSGDSETNTPEKWSLLPVGYSRLMNNDIGISGGNPGDSWYYFHKIANSSQSGGWGGIALDLGYFDGHIGFATTSESLPTWTRIHTDRNYPNITSIEKLSGITGLLRKTATNAWILDENEYITSEQSNNYEASLGNPAVNGYLLSSTTSGVRSWVTPYIHPLTHPQNIIDDTSGWITTALSGKQPIGSYAATDHTHPYAGSSSVGGAAISADKLTTGRKIKIGATEQTFDGTEDIEYTQEEMGVAAIHHTHVPVDVGADPIGTAIAEVSAHDAAPDSHPDLRNYIDDGLNTRAPLISGQIPWTYIPSMVINYTINNSVTTITTPDGLTTSITDAITTLHL